MSSPSGHWAPVDRTMYSTDNVYCRACGAMIPSEYWHSGDGRAYCNRDCLELEQRVDRLRAWYAASPAAEEQCADS